MYLEYKDRTVWEALVQGLLQLYNEQIVLFSNDNWYSIAIAKNRIILNLKIESNVRICAFVNVVVCGARWYLYVHEKLWGRINVGKLCAIRAFTYSSHQKRNLIAFSYKLIWNWPCKTEIVVFHQYYRRKEVLIFSTLFW